jgi:hypothetical protein
MGSGLFLVELHRVHEPENRKCLGINGAIPRFMGRDLFLSELHSDYEPSKVQRSTFIWTV